jgi:hypothetical protein
MYWDKHTLTAPNGSVIAAGGRDEVEDRLARIIERDGFPVSGAYVMRAHWETDGRWAPEGIPMSRTYLGVDSDGWYELDESKVPTTAAPARKIEVKDGE